MFTLAKGQIITIGQEVEFWNDDETRLDWRTDRWAKFQITEILEINDEYATLELQCRDGICSDSVTLDVDLDDIIPAE